MMPGANDPRAKISIILPVFNDEEWIARALESCINQSLEAIEIIVVDDASTDATVSIVDRFGSVDRRVKLIQLNVNSSALQARRVGIEVASTDYVLFLDGDDELAPAACATALAKAEESGADLVGFGCVVVFPDGTTGSHYEKSMQPRHQELLGQAVVENLFPAGANAQGQLWRYLFTRSLLMQAYESLPAGLSLPRMNDLPIAFLAAMYARQYVSIGERLYRYYFRSGASGHQVATWDDYLFNASAIESIESIESCVSYVAENSPRPSNLHDLYASARSSVIGRVLNYVSGISDIELQESAVAALMDRVGGLALVVACADFCPKVLPLLSSSIRTAPLPVTTPSHVVLRTGNLRTGGVQGVVVSQASLLLRKGIKVTIVLDTVADCAYSLPPDVQLLQLDGESRGQKIQFLARLCKEESVDAVIDHHIFYNDRWPYFALGLSGADVPTIGWIHNFALRPLLDEVTRLSFLDKYLSSLNTVVVLSESDVAYWKLRGVENVVFLPNPTSPLVDELGPYSKPRSAPVRSNPLQIVWWGRLQQRTKQVLDLIDVGVHLRDLGIDFVINIIGPDGPDLSADRIRRKAQDRGISKNVVLVGQLHGAELISAIQACDLFVSTSIVEGYPLALVEAQALGLPIVMYDLPWLEFLRDNSGAATVPQGDRSAIATLVAEIGADPVRYSLMSEGAIDAVRAERSHDLEGLYVSLLQGGLRDEYSPEPSLSAMRVILNQNMQFVERLDRIHRRELRRKDSEFSRRYRSLEAEAKRSAITKTELSKRPAPMIPKVRALFQRFLPATMRQAAYYARHEYSVSREQHRQLLSNQAALSAQLARLESRVGPFRK